MTVGNLKRFVADLGAAPDKIAMSESDKKVYLDLRSKIIKYFQDTRNGRNLINPYPLSDAIKIAENQLKYDLQHGELRITIEEMLLNSDEECIQLISNRANKKFIYKFSK